MTASVEEVALRLSLQGEGGTTGGIRKVRGEVKGLTDDVGKLSKSKSGIDDVSKSTLHWGDAFKDLHRNARGFDQSLDRMVNRGVVGIAALTGGAVAWGLRTAGAFELSRTAYGTLLRDVDKGNDLFNELQAYNLEAPFDFSGISAAEQTLLQFGIAGEKALPVLKGLGDVASMTSDPTANLQSMAVALGQISSAGVLRAQDLNQLVQAGFPAYALLSEISGKTSAQLRKDMETGLTLPSSKFVDAIEHMQGRVLEVYKGGAEKQNNTLVGQWSNFKDMLARNLASGLEPSMPEIKAELPVLAQSLADAISQMGPELPRLVSSAADLAPVVTDLVSGFADLVNQVAPFVEDLGHLLGPTGVETLLGVLIGYRVLRGVAGAVTTFASALDVLTASEVAANAAAGGGVAGGGKMGLLGRLGVAGAVLGTADVVTGGGVQALAQGPHAYSDFSHRLGAKIDHATTAAVGWAVGPAPTDNFETKRVHVENVNIHQPQNDIDVANAFEWYIRQREERR